jgi:hypothetical protein
MLAIAILCCSSKVIKILGAVGILDERVLHF